MDLSILVISYNTAELTCDAIASVYEQTDMREKEICVFDNASSDDSVNAIKNRFPSVKLIASSENHGFALANNLLASETTSEYILLLNPDTVVLDGAIDKLLAFAKNNPQAGIWGGRTLFQDHSLNPLSCFRKMSLWNQFCRASGLAAIFKNTELFNGEEFGGWRRDTVREVDIVSGCFLLIKRSLWLNLSGFDKKFFMYAEDADLCLRAQRFGAKPMITPDATIIHYGGASERVKSDKMVRLLKAKAELINTHWASWQKPVGRLLLQSWVLTRIIALTFRQMIRGSSDDLKSWKDVWSRRRDWVRGYIVDSEST